jgi:uncharacterized protein GlcG (DUF336 family)
MTGLHRTHHRALLALLVSVAAGAADAPAAPPAAGSLAIPELISQADALRMAQASLADCVKRGQPTTVVIVDANGFQRVALSDDNAKLIGVAHTRLKAAAVLAFKASTQVLQARVTTDKQFADQYGKDERYLLQAGGLPVYRNGKLVAAISVGGSGNVNEDCAQAGVKALSWATIEPTR